MKFVHDNGAREKKTNNVATREWIIWFTQHSLNFRGFLINGVFIPDEIDYEFIVGLSCAFEIAALRNVGNFATIVHRDSAIVENNR